MFSGEIFKQTLKANWKLWLIFTVVPVVFFVLITAVFDPTAISGMAQMLEGTPLAAMVADASFLSIISQSFYTLQGVLLPMIFIVMTANSLIAAQVDRGSMAYLLSTPTKRSTVVRTQALYLVTSLVAMFAIITVGGFIAIHTFQSFDQVSLSDFMMLNGGLFLLMFATSGVSFFFSCLFNLSKNSLALGAGLPIAFFLMHMMAGVDESLSSLRFLSLNSLFDTGAILAGDSMFWPFTALAATGVALYWLGFWVFTKKDLPL